MSCHVPEKRYLRGGLLLLFHWKKTAAESHQILVESYGEHALHESQCRKWFQRFKSGDFDLNDKEGGKPPKKFEDTDQKGVLYYELLKSGQTITGKRYKQQLIELNRALKEKRPKFAKVTVK